MKQVRVFYIYIFMVKRAHGQEAHLIASDHRRSWITTVTTKSLVVALPAFGLRYNLYLKT